MAQESDSGAEDAQDTAQFTTMEQAIAVVLSDMRDVAVALHKEVTSAAAMLEHVKDMRMRDALNKQLLVWQSNLQMMNAIGMLVAMNLAQNSRLNDVHAAMGCDVRRDN